MIRSFRARLTIWNVIVIGVVLIGFSAAIIFANQARLSADIDRELADRAMHAPPPGPGRGGFGQGQPGQGPEGGPGGRGGQGFGGPAGPPPENGQRLGGQGGTLPPRFNDPVAIRFADVRRPRRFDIDGQPIGPMQDAAFDLKAVAAALRGDRVYTNGQFDSEPIRIFTMPIREGNEIRGAIQVARETRDLNRIWSAQLWTLLLFLPGALIGAAAGAFFLTSRATKPIAQLKEAADAISGQDLSRRLSIQGQDEFAELGATFNQMAGRLEESFTNLKAAYQTLEQSHETQKRFTADASHELRTPLTRLRMATSSALAEGASDDERRHALEIADSAAKSMGRLVQEMLVLARADAGQLTVRKERLDLRIVATDALQGFSNPALEADIQDSPVMIEGDSEHLGRVLTNLIENALRYTPAGGTARLSVCSKGECACLRVSDNGEGIAPEHLPHLTERFYRADPARARSDGGVGLGLAICKTIVEAHGGSMEIASELGRGTSVSITLPRA